MQLSASCQLSVFKPTVAGDESSAAAMSRKDPGQAATFGGVLSAKMQSSVANRPLSASKPTVANDEPLAAAAGKEALSGGKAKAAKPKPDKQNGDDLAPAATFPVAGIQSPLPFTTTAQCEFSLPQENSRQASAGCNTASERSVVAANAGSSGAAPAAGVEPDGHHEDKSALSFAAEGAARQDLTGATTSSVEAQATQNTEAGDEDGSTTANQPGDAWLRPTVDTSASPVPHRSHDLLARTIEKGAEPTSASGMATLENTSPQNPSVTGSAVSSKSSVRQPPSDHAAETTETAVGAATSIADRLTDVSGLARDVESKAIESSTAPLNSATFPTADGAPKHIADRPNRSEPRSDANGTKPSQPSRNLAPAAEQTGSTVDDSTAARTHIAQPTPTVATHDAEDKTGTPPKAVLPEAGVTPANTANAKDAKPQTVPAASSMPAENASSAPPIIQSARVLERMGQSEMRLGMNSSDFGSIELQAHVSQDRVGASIATSHTELRAAMMAEMPSLEHAIAQHQLKLDSFNLDPRTGAQNSGTGASAGNQSPRSWTQPASKVSEFTDDTAVQDIAPLEAWATSHRSGLNVHA